MPCFSAVFTQKRCSYFSCRDSRNRHSGISLTDPMPESATESLESTLGCVFGNGSSMLAVQLLCDESVVLAVPASVSPPTGQSTLAVIGLFLVSLYGGVTVILGTGLSTPPILLSVDGAETWLIPNNPAEEEGLLGESWSEPENLLIRSFTLPALCKYELRDRPAAAFL